MATIKNPEEVTIHKLSPKVFELTTIYGGIYRHKVYMGYTKPQALKEFKDAIKKGEI